MNNIYSMHTFAEPAEKSTYQDLPIQGETRTSRFGPKSEGPSTKKLGWRITPLAKMIFMSQCVLSRGAGIEARVGVDPTRTPGAGHGLAKPHGMQEASMPTYACVEARRSIKRSYRRATTRAMKYGGAYYRGTVKNGSMNTSRLTRSSSEHKEIPNIRRSCAPWHGIQGDWEHMCFRSWKLTPGMPTWISYAFRKPNGSSNQHGATTTSTTSMSVAKGSTRK